MNIFGGAVGAIMDLSSLLTSTRIDRARRAAMLSIERRREAEKAAVAKKIKELQDGADAEYRQYCREYEEDAEMFQFSCRRDGQWLTMEWEDEGAKNIKAINLSLSPGIEVDFGAPPNRDGRVVHINACGQIVAEFEYGVFTPALPGDGNRVVRALPSRGTRGAITFAPGTSIRVPRRRVAEIYDHIIACIGGDA